MNLNLNLNPEITYSQLLTLIEIQYQYISKDCPVRILEILDELITYSEVKLETEQ